MLDALRDIAEIRALLQTITPPVRPGPTIITENGGGGGGKRVLHIF